MTDADARTTGPDRDRTALRESSDESNETPPDPEVAVERIRTEASAVRDQQVERALSKLDAQGEVTAEQRAAVERLADRLVERLVAVPERGLRAADEESDELDHETVETALDLFG